MTQPQPETHYCFKEFVTPDGENKPRLLTPWGDPMEHEFPMDWYFNSPEEAYAAIEEYDWQEDAKNWVLVKEVITPLVHVVDGKPEPITTEHFRSIDLDAVEACRKMIAKNGGL